MVQPADWDHEVGHHLGHVFVRRPLRQRLPVKLDIADKPPAGHRHRRAGGNADVEHALPAPTNPLDHHQQSKHGQHRQARELRQCGQTAGHSYAGGEPPPAATGRRPALLPGQQQPQRHSATGDHQRVVLHRGRDHVELGQHGDEQRAGRGHVPPPRAEHCHAVRRHDRDQAEADGDQPKLVQVDRVHPLFRGVVVVGLGAHQVLAGQQRVRLRRDDRDAQHPLPGGNHQVVQRRLNRLDPRPDRGQTPVLDDVLDVADVVHFVVGLPRRRQQAVGERDGQVDRRDHGERCQRPRPSPTGRRPHAAGCHIPPIP